MHGTLVRMKRVFLLFCVVLFLFGMDTAAQTKPPKEDDTVIRVDTELVDVPISVTDKTGKPLTTLSKNHFLVYEDGKPQKIEEFAAVSAPFEVALLLDTSGSTRDEIELIRRAAADF